MQKLIIKISCLLMCLILVACASNNNSPVELRVQDGYIQYDNGSGWTNLISTEELKGEQGEQGIQGEKGETGDKGEKGDKGDKGDPGTNGTNGTNGKDGTNGVDGKDGVNGKDGANGVNGKDGKDGIDGKDGVDGKDGKDGQDGKDGKDAEEPGLTKTVYVYITLTDNCGNIEYEDRQKWFKNCYEIISNENSVISNSVTTDWSSYRVGLRFEVLMNENSKVKIKLNKAIDNIANYYWFNEESDVITLTYDCDIFSSYNGNPYTIRGEFFIDNTIIVPDYVKGVTTLGDYEKSLEEAGFKAWAVGPVTTGATKENNGTVATVNPSAGSKVSKGTSLGIGVYEYHQTATIPGNLLGTSESNFLAKLKSLGFNNVAKSNITYYSTTLANGTIFSYDDGTFDTGTTINYALSVGPYTFNASDFVGLTTEEVTSKVKDLQNRNAAKGNLSVSFKPGEKDSSQAGKVHDCSYSSSTISCYVYQSSDSDKTVTTASILPIADIRSNYTGENFDIIQNKVREYLNGQGFYNLTFNSVAAEGYYVSEIYVGNQKHTSAASYDTSSNVTVYIAYPNN